MLDFDGYVRYDFSMVPNLLEVTAELEKDYGSFEGLRCCGQEQDSTDIENRLLELKGIGPVAVSIFLRELRAVWSKANH